ncbi:MAG: pseudouridine synthase [Candidatus Latescibacterota bacterium]
MRLNRFLSASGYISRRKGEHIIRAGRVRVNGKVITDPAYGVSPGLDQVALDGQALSAVKEHRYYILNKPAGVIVSIGDTHGRTTVLDLLGSGVGRVYPVGRLDANTSGVLLLTDDGDLAFRLTHPSFGVEKVYRAVVKGRVSAGDIRKVGEGLVLEDGLTAPALMRILKSGAESSTVELTLHEGRKRQVRRMMEHLGRPVISLERISFCSLTAEGLPPGAYRPLTAEEVDLLKRETATRRAVESVISGTEE